MTFPKPNCSFATRAGKNTLFILKSAKIHMFFLNFFQNIKSGQTKSVELLSSQPQVSCSPIFLQKNSQKEV